jgi:hypothetical protein
MIIMMKLRMPKNKVKPPSALVLAVRYIIIAPIAIRVTPNNFSARFTKNVSPSSLIAVFALSLRVNGYIKQDGLF